MARRTTQTRIIEQMTAKGYEFVGMTSGWYSHRKGSNMRRLLDQHGLTEETATVEVGARAGRHLNDGNYLLVFRNPA